MIKNHLHLACYDGQDAVVKKLLKADKKQVNSKDKNGWTPLHCAAARGHLKVCKMLIEGGADVAATNLDGASALHYLARINSPENSKLFLEVLRLALKKGARVNDCNRHKETPLHQAAMKGALTALEFLVESGAEVNAQNEFGETALHYAVRLGSRDCIQILLNHDANVFLESERDEGSPLTLAEVTGQAELLAIMRGHPSFAKHSAHQGKAPSAAASAGATTRHGTTSAPAPSHGLPPLSAVPTASGLAVSAGSGSAQHGGGHSSRGPSPVDHSSAAGGASSAPPHGTSVALSARGVPPPAAVSGPPAAITNVAFGIERGSCGEEGCDCEMYQTESHAGGQCLNCGHYPSKHRKAGKAPGPSTRVLSMSDPTPYFDEPAAVTDRNAQQEEMKQEMKHLNAMKPADPLQHSWSIDPAELKLEEPLGEGTAAKVYKGKYRGQVVAVKVIKVLPRRETLDPTQMNDFSKEIEIYSDLRSPHVVLFFGACLGKELCMVFEYCSKGSLYDVLNSVDEDIDWTRALRLSLDISKALNTLHSWKPPIVHRDMKSLNLLVDANWNVKVSDFGLSRFTSGASSNLSTLGKLRGTYAYSAPEVYFGDPFTTKADVFSVGVIFWEIAHRVLTGSYALPYSEYQELVFDFQIIIQVAKNERRPSIPPDCPKDYRDLIVSCWAQQKDNRPEIGEVQATLEAMLAAHNASKPQRNTIRGGQ